MINSLLYYTLNMSSITASIPLTKARGLDLFYTLNRGHLTITSDRTYNLDISLPLNYQSPRTIISVESSSSRILGFPLFVRLFYKTCIQKVYLAKKIQGYILSIIFIICKFILYLRMKTK